MKQLIERLRAAFLGLAPRERLLVSAALALLLLTLLWFASLRPLLAAGSGASERVEMAEQRLEVMRRLRRDFDEVNLRLASVEERIRNGARGNLRTGLEALARDAQVKIDSMEPQAAPTNERYRETKVEVNLKQVSLPQAIRYLHGIESSDMVLSIKSLRVRVRPETPDLLDVKFTVSAFEPI